MRRLRFYGMLLPVAPTAVSPAGLQSLREFLSCFGSIVADLCGFFNVCFFSCQETTLLALWKRLGFVRFYEVFYKG
jgi:hypothetical protein